VVLDHGVDASVEISVSGGAGVMEQDALTYLLQFAGYPITPEAAMMLRNVKPFDLSVLLNASGNVLATLRNLIAQTRFASTFRHGKFHLFDLVSETPLAELGIGTGLLFPLAQQPQGQGTVFNRFVLQCGRDHQGSTATVAKPLFTVVRDMDHGSVEIKSLLAESERFYGPRQMPVFSAADLAVTRDLETGAPNGCPAGELLADLLARTHAVAPRARAYQADWHRGMPLDVGWNVLLRDGPEQLNGALRRIVSWKLAATGPQIVVL
jgi:hypothetical protein